MEVLWQPSPQLAERLSHLSPTKQHGVRIMALSLVNGVAWVHLVHTPYSCPHCGRYFGGGPTPDRCQRDFEEHQLLCERRQDAPWEFLCCEKIMKEWHTDPEFNHTLLLAVQELQEQIVGEAYALLRGGAWLAAHVVFCLIKDSPREDIKLRASLALIDRLFKMEQLLARPSSGGEFDQTMLHMTQAQQDLVARNVEV